MRSNPLEQISRSYLLLSLAFSPGKSLTAQSSPYSRAMETIFILLAIGSAALCLFFYMHLRNGTRLPLPPGPKALPIVGNILSLPPKGIPEYQHWLKFKDQYGPISSITVFGQTTIILHGKDEVEDLMEKLSLKTSNRPSSTFVNMSGFDRYIPSMQYNASWRQHRKIMHQYLGTEKLSRQFNYIQNLESRRLLLRILATPKSLMQHFKTRVHCFYQDQYIKN